MCVYIYTYVHQTCKPASMSMYIGHIHTCIRTHEYAPRHSNIQIFERFPTLRDDWSFANAMEEYAEGKLFCEFVKVCMCVICACMYVIVASVSYVVSTPKASFFANFERTLRLSWPAESKVKRFSRSTLNPKLVVFSLLEACMLYTYHIFTHIFAHISQDRRCCIYITYEAVCV